MPLGRPDFAKQQIIMCKIFEVETDIFNDIIIIVVEPIRWRALEEWNFP